MGDVRGMMVDGNGKCKIGNGRWRWKM